MKLACIPLIAVALTASVSAAPLKLSEKQSRQVMADFARCIAKEEPELASRAVVEDWQADLMVGTKGELLRPGCVGKAGLISAIRVHAPNLRAALAEQLLSRDPGLTLSAETAHSQPPLAYRQPWPVATVDKKGKALKPREIEAKQKGHASRLAIIAGQQIAECVARTNPEAVRAIFATKIGGEPEMAAFRALGPSLPPCVPSGKQFSFDRSSLRGTLALSYYRLAMASRGVVWAGEAEASTVREAAK